MQRAVRNILFGLLALTATPLSAAPVVLKDSASVERLARLIKSYSNVQRVRWVIAGGDSLARADAIGELERLLGDGHEELMERVRSDVALASRALVDSTGADNAALPRAFIEIASGRTDCSWQVTVTDPSAPSAGTEAIAIPLEPGDRVPASSVATFQVGFNGPLQSTFYAMAETEPGAIRDLAAAPQIAIPVADKPETLVLVRARKSVPFFDTIRDSLAREPGNRGHLGPNAELAGRFSGNGRGIGALIQLVDPEMIVADAGPLAPQPDASSKTAAPTGDEPKPAPVEVPIARLDDLTETCLFTIEPAAQL